jgi:hypothetical protein
MKLLPPNRTLQLTAQSAAALRVPSAACAAAAAATELRRCVRKSQKECDRQYAFNCYKKCGASSSN